MSQSFGSACVRVYILHDRSLTVVLGANHILLSTYIRHERKQQVTGRPFFVPALGRGILGGPWAFLGKVSKKLAPMTVHTIELKPRCPFCAQHVRLSCCAGEVFSFTHSKNEIIMNVIRNRASVVTARRCASTGSKGGLTELMNKSLSFQVLAACLALSLVQPSMAGSGGPYPPSSLIL